MLSGPEPGLTPKEKAATQKDNEMVVCDIGFRDLR